MALSFKRIVAAAAFAVSSASIAAPCGIGTLADYIALGSCAIGGTTFTGFELVAPLPEGSTPIDAAAIAVTPFVSATNPGFAFAFTAAAGPGDLLATLFRFQVVASAGATLTRADQELAGASATNDGVVLLISDVCFDGLFAPPPFVCGGAGSDAMISFATEFDAEPTAFSLLGALGVVDVVANFIIDGGLSGGATASGGSLRFLTDAVTRVDEPPLLALLAFLLFALAASRRGARRRC